MLFWLLAMVVAESLIWVTKVIYARPRPPMALVTTHSYSFPSGHAGTAAAVAVGVVRLEAGCFLEMFVSKLYQAHCVFSIVFI